MTAAGGEGTGPEPGAARLPDATRVLVLTCGKAATAAVQPRRFFAALAPWGPADPRDPVLRPPFPDIAIASGRATAPYLRALKRASGGRVFTVYLQDPRAWRGAFDVVWAPEHDGISGPNVLRTLTSPHTLTPAALAAARAEPDPRVAATQGPRLAMVLGGPSKAYRYKDRDIVALERIARAAAEDGHSVLVTPSRRTPPELIAEVEKALADLPAERRFVWDGSGANPYVAMIANADAILVTADSVNMLGEAAATGAPVHLYEPTGGSPKITRFLEGMFAHGAARRWRGAVESWRYQPLDATGYIASRVLERWRASAAAQTR
jgi:mitochondrial fission protein ELM1